MDKVLESAGTVEVALRLRPKLEAEKHEATTVQVSA
jgi:hypothetical protein